MSRIEAVIRFMSIALLAFVCGFYTYHFKTFPYQILAEAASQASTWKKEKKIQRLHHLKPAVYERHGTQTLIEDAVQPGLTLIASFWSDMDGKAGLKLIDKDGLTIHKWETNLREWWPDAPLGVEAMNMYIHGSHLLPNGDVLFNVEYIGLFMVDSCGQLKWHLNHTTHHSVARDEQGNFWVPGNIKLNGQGTKGQFPQFPGLQSTPKQPVWEDRLLKVSPEGEVLADISLLEVIYENNLQRYIPKIAKRKNGDILHLNDIDILDSSIAEQYPLFEAGDLVVSVRNLHMILVMDPLTRVVKWHSTNPWIEQHDPDFTGDGWITVFDNNKGFSEATGSQRGKMLGGSRLVAVRPHTQEIKIAFPRNDDNFFYTKLGGKFQQLANGNYLVTETKAGRVFEVQPDGKLVWEWIKTANENRLVAEVMEGTRYDISPEQVASWSCSLEATQ